MEKEKIDRINELARKAKIEPLTPEELAERDVLRRQYLDEFKQGFKNILDNTYIQREDGTKEKLKPKGH